MAKKSSIRVHLWLIMAVFVISLGGKRSLCMADDGEDEVVSVEVHVDGMTVRGAARREAVEEARRMAEMDVNVEEHDAIWDTIDTHVAKLNAMADELTQLKIAKRRLGDKAKPKPKSKQNPPKPILMLQPDKKENEGDAESDGIEHSGEPQLQPKRVDVYFSKGKYYQNLVEALNGNTGKEALSSTSIKDAFKNWYGIDCDGVIYGEPRHEPSLDKDMTLPAKYDKAKFGAILMQVWSCRPCSTMGQKCSREDKSAPCCQGLQCAGAGSVLECATEHGYTSIAVPGKK